MRTLRNECLDHVVVVNEAHLRAVLTEFVRYYNVERPHRALALETPTPAVRAAAGPISSRPVLVGSITATKGQRDLAIDFSTPTGEV